MELTKYCWNVAGLLVLVVCIGCGGDDGADGGDGGGGGGGDAGVGGVIDGACNDVRMTFYSAGEVGSCEFPNTLAVLPEFVRAHRTIAIAEPWYGSSYGGDPGEACGECWEITRDDTVEVVMVHNLCPANDNNPLCSDPARLHFDLTREAHQALGFSNGVTGGQARPVPCPVGDRAMHAYVQGRSNGFLAVIFLNHRYPVRSVRYRSDSPGSEWLDADRRPSGDSTSGVWRITGPEVQDGAPGLFLEITSAEGQTVETTNVLPANLGPGDTPVDLGAQFELRDDALVCEYVPPAVVYDDAFGGVPGLEWRANPNTSVTVSEVSDGCATGSSCLELSNFQQFQQAQLFRNDRFVATTFARFSLAVRARAGAGTVSIALEDGCARAEVAVDETWQTVELGLPGDCASSDLIDRIAIRNEGAEFVALIDDVRFARD